MNYSGFNSQNIYKDEIISLKGISSLSISNYSDTALNVTISNVVRIVPAYNPALQVPYIFNIDGDGTFADIQLELTYASNAKNGNAILDYRKEKKC